MDGCFPQSFSTRGGHLSAGQGHDPLPAGRFETKDIRFGAIAALIGALLVMIAGTVWIALVLDRMFTRAASLRDAPRSPMTQGRLLPPEPRLQVSATADLLRMRDAEDAILNNYAWIDPAAGKARIPIARAMAILAERSAKRTNSQ